MIRDQDVALAELEWRETLEAVHDAEVLGAVVDPSRADRVLQRADQLIDRTAFERRAHETDQQPLPKREPLTADRQQVRARRWHYSVSPWQGRSSRAQGLRLRPALLAGSANTMST